MTENPSPARHFRKSILSEFQRYQFSKEWLKEKRLLLKWDENLERYILEDL